MMKTSLIFFEIIQEQKQKRIQELEQLLASEREQSETWAEIQRLREENKTKQVALVSISHTFCKNHFQENR